MFAHCATATTASKTATDSLIDIVDDTHEYVLKISIRYEFLIAVKDYSSFLGRQAVTAAKPTLLLSTISLHSTFHLTHNRRWNLNKA